MRELAEAAAWRQLERESSNHIELPVRLTLPNDAELLLTKRCHIIAGLNGSGKSEALRNISTIVGEQSRVIRLHQICEQVKSTLESRSDIEEMEAEVGPITVDPDLRQSLARVIGKDYSNVEWFSLELQSTRDVPFDWPWPTDEQQTVPHFRVEENGLSYSSLQMGLGEFSVHLLFWILWQFRHAPGIILLLDEPDAYLPPRTRMRFLALLLSMARDRHWQLVVSTHSELVINAAHEQGALIVVNRQNGSTRFYPSAEHGFDVVRELVPQLPADLILFCEDESAAALTRALLRSQAPDLAESTAVLWKDGDGYLRKLSQHLPRTSASPVRFSLVFDGDQRASIGSFGLTSSRWPSLCLPTTSSPDALFRECQSSPDGLAEALNCGASKLAMILAALQGSEDHDWVNGLCDKIGLRTLTLDVLATLWVARNPDLSVTFCEELRSAL